MMRRFAELASPPREKFIAVYLGKDGSVYKFVERLSHGTQSMVQLVQDAATGELMVRKSPRSPGSSRAIEDIIAHLNGNIGRCPSGVTPLYEQLLKSGDRPDPHMPHVDLPTTYWRFCNGGNLEWFLELYGTWNPIPDVIIARFLHHLLGTLHYVMNCLPRPLFHGDVLPMNVFLVWNQTSRLPDFYLGDWGRSVPYTDYQRYPGRGEYTRNGKYFWDLGGVLEMLKTMICRGHPVSEFPAVLSQSRFRDIYEELERMDMVYQEWESAEEVTKAASAVWLPDTLMNLIDAAKQFEQVALREYCSGDVVRIRRVFEVAENAPAPESYDTREMLIEAMNNRIPLFHGPWYVARVNSRTGEVLEVLEDKPSPTE